jgi:hypothetical protein
MSKSPNPVELEDLIKRGVGVVASAGAAQMARPRPQPPTGRS